MTGMNNLTICCPSNWLADRVRRSFLKDAKVERVFNGIDTTGVFYPRPVHYARDRHDLGSSRVLLAVASNLADPVKGLDWLLKLADRLRDVPVTLVLIGLEEPVQAPNIVSIPPTKDQNALAEYYSAADLLVLPSRKETFSLVCAEALACGASVVGFDSGAPTEIAPPGYGAFVPYGDLEGLEDAIRNELFGVTRLASRDECRRFAVDRYGDSTMAANYLDVYERAIDRR